MLNVLKTAGEPAFLFDPSKRRLSVPAPAWPKALRASVALLHYSQPMPGLREPVRPCQGLHRRQPGPPPLFVH
jgi:hypothetical protein